MATETKKHECPASGCEYSGTEKSVAAHYSGTRKKPDHAGGYETARQRMGTGETKNSEETGSSSTDDSDSTDSVDRTTKTHPTFGEGETDDPEPENETKEVDLPCGCETFQPSNAPKSKGYVTCDTCGKTFQYEL